MQENRELRYIKLFMLNMNLWMVVFLSFFISYTTYKIGSVKDVVNFLEKSGKIPMEPWKVPIICILVFGVLLVCMKRKNYLEKGISDFYISFLLELGAGGFIILVLDMNYNGVLLLIIADLILYRQNTRGKIACLSGVFLLYVLTGFELFSNQTNLISIQTYLGYYNAETRIGLASVSSILKSINNLLFMGYMVLLIRLQVQENERIRNLNQKLDEANESLQRANEQLEEYARTTEKMVETRERNRLAREIHDTLGHVLTGIAAGIDACMTLIDYSIEDTKKQMHTIRSVARQGIKDVRRSVNALRPDALEELSLDDALEQIVTEMSTIAQVEIVLENKIKNLEVDEDEAEVIYRIVQESVTNAIRHGKADHIHILMENEFHRLLIKIKDNGIGCKEIKKGFGLRHMSERVEILNGKLEYIGEEGFTVLVRLPIRWGKGVYREELHDKGIDCR